MGQGAGLRVAALLLCLVVDQRVEAVPVESAPPTSANSMLSATEGVLKNVKTFDNVSRATVVNDSTNVPAVQVIVIMLNSSNSTDTPPEPSTTPSALEATTEADSDEPSTLSLDASESKSELSTAATNESSSPASNSEDVSDSEDVTTESESSATETQAPTEITTVDDTGSYEATVASDESTESDDSAEMNDDSTESDEPEITTIAATTTTKKPPPPPKQSATNNSQPVTKGQKKTKKPIQSANVTPSTANSANKTKNKPKKSQSATTPSPSASDEEADEEASDVETSTDSHKQPSANQQAASGDYEVEVIYPSFLPDMPGITTGSNSSLNGFQVVNLSGGNDATTVIVDNGQKIHKLSYGSPVKSAPDNTRLLPPGVFPLQNLQAAETQRQRQQTMLPPVDVQNLWPHHLQANRFAQPMALQHVPPMFYPDAEPVWPPYPAWDFGRIAAPRPYGFQ